MHKYIIFYNYFNAFTPCLSSLFPIFFYNFHDVLIVTYFKTKGTAASLFQQGTHTFLLIISMLHFCCLSYFTA